MQKRINWWMFAGELIAVTGIILTIVLQSPEENAFDMMGIKIDRGILMAASSAIVMSVANITRKLRLDSIPLEVFTIFRTAVGTVFFFTLTVKLYGLVHFQDVLTPVVWQWISIYGIFIVAGGQFLWFQGVMKSNFQSISYAGYLIPLLGILAAYLILGEVPTTVQYIGIITIAFGAVLNWVGISKQEQKLNLKRSDTEHFVGFKGI